MNKAINKGIPPQAPSVGTAGTARLSFHNLTACIAVNRAGRRVGAFLKNASVKGTHKMIKTVFYLFLI